jgi:fructuronate reductase
VNHAAAPRPLNLAALPALRSAHATVPDYDPAGISVGVVHIGLGAFHRAHQADYFNRVLARDPRWGICAVSLHSNTTVNALHAQDGLYVLAERDEIARLRVVGSIRESCMAHDPHFVERLAAPTTKLITLTITEKGYCLGADNQLDFHHPDIVSDCANPQYPASAIGWLVRGLALRRAVGAGGLTVLSCDNLASNGDTLRRAVGALADRMEPGLGAWISGEACFPSAMVDSITPATDDALRRHVRDELGVADHCPVQREAFSAWIIEDKITKDFPPLESAGATFTSDVAAHERAKLRLLNGAHSTLAYLGLARGHTTVAGAMADVHIARFVEAMMRDEVSPSLMRTPAFDLDVYRRALIGRFRNPAIDHKLAQIAWDGSQKLPVRLLSTIRDNLRSNLPVERLCTGVAAWMRFVRRTARDKGELIDPMAKTLLKLSPGLNDQAAQDVPAFLTLAPVFSDLAYESRFRDAVVRGYHDILAYETRWRCP